MLCLEVSVNGTRHCLAAPGDVGSFTADVVRDTLHDDSATATLSVEGRSRDNATNYVWGGNRALTVGDVVTIRLVKATAPDAPVASASGMPAIEPFRPQSVIGLLRDIVGNSDTAWQLWFWLALVL